MSYNAWKIYFWVLIGATFVALCSDVFGVLRGSIIDPNDVVLYVIQFAAIAGVFGYAYKKALLSVAVWRFVLLSQLLMLLYSGYIIVSVQPEPGALTPVSTLLAIAMVVLILPELVALYLYSFRSRYLWEQ